MRRLQRFLPLIALLMVSGMACMRSGKQAPSGGSEVPPSKVNLRRNVYLTKAVQTNLVYTVETVGVIEAEGTTELAAGVPGQVDDVLFREGDVVEPSQRDPLVRISQPLYEAALRVAEFEVQRAESKAAEAGKNWELAKKNPSSLSETELLQREYAVKLSDAEVSAAKAALERAKYNLGLSQMKPPYRGRINKRMVTKGSHVEEKTVIATMADLSRLRLTTYVPESATSTVREYLDRRERLAAIIQASLAASGVPEFSVRAADLPGEHDPDFNVLAFPGQTFKARIFYLSTVGDPSTHQFECKAEITIPKDAPQLLPGFTARVRMPLKTRRDAVLVPEESLRSTERGWLVFTPEKRVGKDGKPEWLARTVRVEPGYRNKGMVEIRSGLAGGEVIVQRGADALEEEGGTPLKIPDDQMVLLEKMVDPKP